MSGIGENRVFDRAALEELKEQAAALMKCASEATEELSKEMDALLLAVSEIPVEARHPGLESAAESLKGKLDTTIYDDLKAKLTENLEKLINLIPLYDSQSCAVLEELSGAAKSIRGMVEELKNFIHRGSLTLSLEEFGEKLEDFEKNWQTERQHLEGNMLLAMTYLKGLTATSAYSKDPVNLSTGNFFYEKQDLNIPGLPPLTFGRYYNALDRRSSALGEGWSHTHGERLEKKGEELVLYRADGKETTFRKEGEEYWDIHTGRERLVKEKDTYRYEEGGLCTCFLEDGRLLFKKDRDGNEIRYSHDENKRVVKAEQVPGGGSLLFSYGEEGFLKEVCDHTGRSLTFFYLEGKLSEVTDPEGHTSCYRYGENGKLRGVRNPAGVLTVRNTYDEQGRVASQRFPDKGEMHYAYEEGNRTILTERNGSRMTYVQDEHLRHVKTIYHDSEESFTYDEKDRLTGKTDRNGNHIGYTYDEKGNLTGLTDALGEKTGFTYNGEGKLLRVEKAGKLYLENRYDKGGHLQETEDILGRKRTHCYNERGQVTEILHPDGGKTRLTYDEKGNILCIREADGVETGYRYDTLNRVCATRDGNGNETTYAYDRKDRLIKVTNPEGNSRSYSYNGSGKVVRVEDFDGGVSTISYNALNRPEVFRDKEGRETRRRYDRMWNLSEEQSPTGAITRYHYDEDNRLCLLELCSREGEEAALVYAYTHDCNGNLLSAKAGDHTMKEGGEALCVVSYTYDALNRPVTETDAEGNTTTYVYNREGQMESITDGAGNRRSFAYNAGGECISETDEEGNTTTYTYHASGQISGVKDPAGRETSYEYLPGGRLKTIRYPDGRFLSYAYDKNGNLIKKQDSEGYEITYAYDCMNRLVRAEDNRGRKKGYAYDAMGNVTGVTDALGNTTKYAYTISGKLSAVTDAAGARTEYRYDALDNLVCVCQKGKNGEEERITRYVRDPFGRTETIIDALGGEEHYTYDALGRVISKTDREGFVTRNSYDGRGNLSGILYGDGKRVELEYDALSRLIQVKDWLGTTSITRDRKGNPVRVLDYEGRETRYEWGSLGEKKSMTYPDGKTVHFSYDGMLRPATMGIHRKGEEEQTIRYRYDEAGRLSGKEFPEGLKTTWLYNREGQLEELLHEDREGILDHYSYTYDAMGNKTGITRKRRGAEAENGSYGYAYDVLGRLTEVEKDGEVLRRYRYDSFGNRVGMEEAATGRTKDYRYDVLNRLTRLEEQYRGEHHFTEYGYDRRGNLTEEWKDGVLLHGYTYGADNRLQTSRNRKGEKAGYRYNGLGDRTGKNVTGRGGERREESYLLDLTRPYNNLLAVTGGEKEQYFYWDGNVTAMEEEGRLHYYFPDDLGSPLRVSGFSVEPGTGRETGSYLTYGYDEFGQDLYREMEEEGIPNPYMETGEGQPFGYTGYRYDRVGGSYFAQAREYRGELGRFCAEDVHWNEYNSIYGNKLRHNNEPNINAVRQSLNLYVYCMNSPIVYIDKKGAEAGDPFKSMDDAAKDFAKTTNGKSIEEDLEYGSYIYSWQETKKIFWFIPITKTYYSYTEPFTDNMEAHIRFYPNNPPIPKNTIFVAMAHTHGAWKENPNDKNNIDWNDIFSDDDMDAAILSGYPLYLASPDGRLQVFDPEKGYFVRTTKIVDKWKLPHDKNHPDLPAFHKKNCKNCFEED